MADVTIEDLVAFQADQCAAAGSPLYERILRGVLADVRSDGGIVREVVAGHEQDQFGSALVLRMLGAVHRIVLDGRAPELAASYPSVGGDAAAGDPAATFLTTLRQHKDEVARRLDDGLQTNEVGRASVLVAGFATVADRTGLPLRILEMGASAGLNLRWDAYAYEHPGGVAGDPDSPLRFADVWESAAPPLPERFDVAERRGCDPAPIDPATEEGRQRLRSFVWPDQLERSRRLEAALAVAARVPAVVERADGPDWVAERVAEAPAGVATVVVHSIVLQYLPRERRGAFRDAMAAAGRRASEAAPLAWLRFEPGGDVAELRLALWPEGRDELLATSGFHGAPARWLARG